ncbi:MAG: glycosyltransferase [Candidatus Thermoplasmatota archaeon]|nr:glycosyltransferase [Candidatus Thermoplasmatota archaeon]
MKEYGTDLPFYLPEIVGPGNDYSFLEAKLDDDFTKFPISIVIPVYNRIEMLRRTIAMLTHQTYPLELIEVIIADDGSNDKPEQLIDEFSDYFEVNYVKQKDEGYRLSHIRNLGVRSAKHDNIIILDCDMAPVPNLVSLFARWLALEEKVILIGHRKYVDANHIKVSDVIKSPSVMLELPAVATKNAVMKKSPSKDWRESIYSDTNNLKSSPHPFRASSCGNVAFHRQIFSDAGGFDENFTAWGAEDNEFGYRVFNAGYYFIPVLDALGLHQEPPGGREFVDREAGKLITRPMLLDMVPTYREYSPDKMSTTPMVSIYIPAFNAIDTISRAVDSALNQTYRDFEIIICNDGSGDGTGEYLEQNYGENPYVKILHQENGGIGSASNSCIDYAKGMFILQLDSDDELLENALEVLIYSIIGKHDVSCVYGKHNKFDPISGEISAGWHYPGFCRKRMLYGMIVHHPRLFRKRDWAKVGGFSEKIINAVDYDFFQKLSEVGKIEHIDKVLYNYTVHQKSTSVSKSELQTKNTFKVIDSALKRMNLKDWTITRDHTHSGKRAVEFVKTEQTSSFIHDGEKLFVSVVVITKNRANLLRDCIRSILNQSYTNFELLVIDDGSKDNTSHVVNSFNDGRIRYIKKDSTGIPKSRNLGVKEAKGEYIVIMDDDDLMLPNRIQEQINCLTEGSSGSYGGWIDQDSNLEHDYFPGGEHGFSQILFGSKIMLHPASMIKRDVLLEFPYDENYSFGTDYVMNLEISKAGHKLDHTGSYILLRRFHGGNVTITNSGEQKSTARVRWREFVDELDKDTERELRDNWRKTKFFEETPKPSKKDLTNAFPWMYKAKNKTEATIPKKDTYVVASRWTQTGNVLEFDALTRTVFFDMPLGWRLEDTHRDLFRIAHYFLTSPWESGILDGWEPSRQKGWRNSLSFSGGIDSTACMLLMPSDTILCYNERSGFKSQLNHANAHHFIETLQRDSRPVIIVKSNHEQIRMDRGKGPGFSTDLAAAVQNILLADYLQLRSIALGMPLENAYLFHGHTGRNFADTSYWKNNSEILQKAGLELVFPTAGVSEIINHKIVENSNYRDLAESCLRSSKAGSVCGRCWKCFRKNTMKGKSIEIVGEISTFLEKRPLKQAVSTLYAIQRLPKTQLEEISIRYPDLDDLLKDDYSFIENYLPMSLDLLPTNQRHIIEKRLKEVSLPMNEKQVEMLLTIDLSKS